MDNQKLILVTGGTGYFGGVLIPQLLEKGYRVRIFDKMLFGDEAIRSCGDRIELVTGDIGQPPAGLFDGVFAAIHLAGVSSQTLASNHSPRYTFLTNHIGTEIIGRAAKAAGVERFLLASSCSIYCTYRHTPNDAVTSYKESDSINICNAYALSKRAAEEALTELKDETFCPVYMRKGTMFGYSAKMRYDLIINSFTKDAFSKRKITVSSNGELYRPMIDIQDAVAAYLKALELPAEKVSGQAFNVVTHNRKIGDLANEFRDIIKKEKGIDIEVELKPFEVAYSYQADMSKFTSVFGTDRRRSTSEAILEIWKMLEAGHDFTQVRYYNDPWYIKLFQEGRV
jgi:nucleoside-diphosphate-sugar epimerase